MNTESVAKPEIKQEVKTKCSGCKKYMKPRDMTYKPNGECYKSCRSCRVKSGAKLEEFKEDLINAKEDLKGLREVIEHTKPNETAEVVLEKVPDVVTATPIPIKKDIALNHSNKCIIDSIDPTTIYEQKTINEANELLPEKKKEWSIFHVTRKENHIDERILCGLAGAFGAGLLSVAML